MRRPPHDWAPTCRSACTADGRTCSGVGEIVEPLAVDRRPFTLVIPPLVVPTPAVFRAWDELGGPVDETTANDLTAAAIHVVPELARWRDRITEVTGRTAKLAGSGATWFVDGHQAGLDEALAPRPGRHHLQQGVTRAAGRAARFVLLTTLVASTPQHLLVLLLPHALAALLDQRTHKVGHAIAQLR